MNYIVTETNSSVNNSEKDTAKKGINNQQRYF